MGALPIGRNGAPGLRLAWRANVRRHETGSSRPADSDLERGSATPRPTGQGYRLAASCDDARNRVAALDEFEAGRHRSRCRWDEPPRHGPAFADSTTIAAPRRAWRSRTSSGPGSAASTTAPR